MKKLFTYTIISSNGCTDLNPRLPCNLGPNTKPEKECVAGSKAVILP